MFIGGKRYSGNGAIGRDGAFSAFIQKPTVSLPDPPRITLRLNQADRDLIEGEIVENDVAHNISLHRELVFSKSEPTPRAGSYTFVLPNRGSTGLPLGHGYGSLKISPTGTVNLIGALGDGAKIAQSARLTGESSWPLFSLAYGGKGSALGWAEVRGIPNTSDIDGVLNWYGPPVAGSATVEAGFATEVSLVGSRYVKPTNQSGVLNLPDATVTINLDASGANAQTKKIHFVGSVVTGSAKSEFSMSFVTGTGIFRGKASDSMTKQRLPFMGAVVQKQNNGKGLLFVGKSTGSIEIGL